MEYSREEFNEPASPTGQHLDSTSLCVYIIGVIEFEVPIHDIPIESMVEDAFLSIPRFNSIMACDEKGVKKWKRVEVKLKEHIIEPKFTEGLSVDSYDQHFSDYLSVISMEKLPPTKPLWQVHVIKYPTSNAEGTLVLKFSHAIGDGYILMGLLLSKLQRADNPCLSLSFPSLKSSKPKKTFKFLLKRVHNFLSMAFNFVPDFGWSLLKSTLLEDDKTPIRSGIEAVEFQPTKVSHITFSMDHIKEIKSNLGVTINDLTTGIIFYGIRLYMQDIDYRSRRLNSTSLLITNTRTVKTYQIVQDMLKPAKGAWGNQITYLQLSIPKLEDIPISSPLQFVKKAHTSIRRKRNSFATRLITKLLLMKSKFEGPETVAKDIHRTIRKSSLLVSNVAGPLGKMSWANHHIGGIFFTLSGIPQNLIITIMSYMGMLRVTAKTEEGFMDEQKLMWYLKKSFEIIRHDSIAKENVPTKIKF